MNEIEKIFYDAYMDIVDKVYDENSEFYRFINDICLDPIYDESIGIYKPDFILNKFLIEIDGHEYHKTKEQREKDYIRERYFQKIGYQIIRFTGTEVYLRPYECAIDAMEITARFNDELDSNNQVIFMNGVRYGESKRNV